MFHEGHFPLPDYTQGLTIDIVNQHMLTFNAKNDRER
jgi:hypothetical protein